VRCQDDLFDQRSKELICVRRVTHLNGFGDIIKVVPGEHAAVHFLDQEERNERASPCHDQENGG